MATFIFECRGHAMYNRKKVLDSYLSSIQIDANASRLRLVPEPHNAYDANAIKVMSRGEVFGHIGYVGREYTATVHAIIVNHPSYEVRLIDPKPSTSHRSILLELTYI